MNSVRIQIQLRALLLCLCICLLWANVPATQQQRRRRRQQVLATSIYKASHPTIHLSIHLSVHPSIHPSIHLCNAASHAAQLADPHDAFVCRLWLSLSLTLWLTVSSLHAFGLTNNICCCSCSCCCCCCLHTTTTSNSGLPLSSVYFESSFSLYPPQPFAMHCINHPHRRLYKLICYA